MERIETTEAIIKDGNFTLEKDVGIFEHFLSDDECDKFIDLFHNSKEFTYNRVDEGNSRLIDKKDEILYWPNHSLPFKIDEENNILKRIWEVAINRYTEHYGILKESSLYFPGLKMQKTYPGEGYHVWHFENQGEKQYNSRVLSFVINLNDDFDGGETEFLYKNMRNKPKKGSLTIFPCNYTHTHRGNPPLNNIKYILTGWILENEYD